MKMKKVVFLSTQRSASTLLEHCLSTHPQIQCHGELFQKHKSKYKDSNHSPKHFSIAYEKYRTTSITRKYLHKYCKNKLIHQYLNKIYSLGEKELVIGFKLLYSQAKQFPEILGWLKYKSVGIVYLTREYLIKTLISLGIAQKRNNYSSWEPLELCNIDINTENLKDELTKRSHLIEKYRNLFQSKLYLEVSYETFTTYKEIESRQIPDLFYLHNFLELNTSKHITVNPVLLHDTIENFDEVINELREATFEKFLF